MKLFCVDLPGLAVLLVLLNLLKSVSSLHCIQCDRQESWYSQTENERHIQKCQKGEFEPTKCANASHTHCIYSYYRQGGSDEITITERRCGVEDDVIGCTLYKASRRKIRHLLSGAKSDQPIVSHRRRETTLFVEVCTEGCVGDGCINAAITPSVILAVIASVTSLLLSRMF